MNRFLTFALLISTFCFAKAQDGYIKHLKDSEYKNKTINVLRGEILPFINASIQGKINLIIGIDTIMNIEKASNSFEIFSPNSSYDSQRDDFLQIKRGGIVWVNGINISATDTVTLISESGKKLTQLIDKREAQVNQSELGKTSRLIISNSPTIFYTTDNLKQFVEPSPVQVGAIEETQKIEKKETGWVLWQILLLSVVGIGIIAVGVWWFIKANQEPVYVIYNANKALTYFAKDNSIDVNTLIKYNKGMIDKKYIGYSESDQRNVHRQLKDKKLIVGFRKKGVASDDGNLTKAYTENETITKVWDSPKETYSQSTNLGNSSELFIRLKQIEDNLIKEFKRGINNQSEIGRLREEKTEVESRFRELESLKRNLDVEVMQMKSDKRILEDNLQIAKNEIGRIHQEMESLKVKVIAVDFLKEYSERVFLYLEYCQQVSDEAYNTFNRVSQQNPRQAFDIGHLLLKFQNHVNSIPLGHWLQTVEDIRHSGATTNRKLTRSFSQIQNDIDKQKEFQRLLYSEVLTKYSSNILILAEAFKNLARFQVSTQFANEAENTFGKHVIELVNKAKSTGLDIKYVPLFERWEKYLGQVEDNGGERSLAYKEISDLEKGVIAEIVSFGVRTSLGDDTKTIIILA